MSDVSDVLIFLVAQSVFVIVFGLAWFAGMRIVRGWDEAERVDNLDPR